LSEEIRLIFENRFKETFCNVSSWKYFRQNRIVFERRENGEVNYKNNLVNTVDISRHLLNFLQYLTLDTSISRKHCIDLRLKL